MGSKLRFADDLLSVLMGYALFALMCCLVGMLVLGGVAALSGRSFDATDAPPNRSGMSLHTDAQTGCQYLGGKSGGLTPRLSAEGKHLGCAP